MEKAQQDLETAKAQVPNLEAQLRELEIEYRESGFDEVPYGSWTPGETLISGRGIKEVGDVIKYGGSPAGLKPTRIEYDVAPGAASLRQLGKAALTKTLTKAPPRSALKTRIAEVHRGLDRIAQSQRTTAVLETSDGTRIVASGGRDLTPGQKALLGPREIAAKSPGAHAELTALEQAAKHGLHPAKITASRPFCPECIEAIKSAGGKITSPTTAEFPR